MIPNYVSLYLMEYLYIISIADHESMCIFKALQYQDNNGHLSWEEFSHFYEVENMKWQLVS